jgi:hypothetical protein
MADKFNDAPLQLVIIREDGVFEITVEGINFLSSLKNKKVLLYLYRLLFYLLLVLTNQVNLFFLTSSWISIIIIIKDQWIQTKFCWFSYTYQRTMDLGETNYST